MEYEQILFGLQPLINARSPEDVPMDDVFLQSYLTVLDQLAVHLRSESNRDLIRETGLFKNLLVVLDSFLDHAFHTEARKNQFYEVSSELIRCVANSLIDNDLNRETFWGKDINKRNEFIDYYAGKILTLSSDEKFFPDLQFRTLVLILNLIMENEKYCKRVLKGASASLMKLIISLQNVFLEDEYSTLSNTSLEILSIFVENGFQLNQTQLFELSNFLQRVADCILSVNLDENTEYTSDEGADETNESFLPEMSHKLSSILFNVTKDENIDLSNSTATSSFQQGILTTLELLDSKQFENKLLVMRELLSTVGNVSCNSSYSNNPDIEKSLALVKNSQSSYAMAAALIIISNYIDGPPKVDIINSKISYEDLIKCSTKFKDPIQFQGFLDLFKKLLKMDLIMFLSDNTTTALANVLIICHDQCKYYEGLSPLLEKLLEKLFAVAPTKLVIDLLNSNDRFAELTNERSIVVTCLAIDKLSKRQSSIDNHILNNLLTRLVRYIGEKHTNLISDPLEMFHITRSIGVYLSDTTNETRNLLFDQFSKEIEELLNIAISLKNDKGSASEAVFNNCRFISGLIISSKCDFIDDKLKVLAHDFF